MNDGQTYRCESCDREMEAAGPLVKTRETLRCKCGGQMKRLYAKPAVRKISAEIETLTVAKMNRT
jgi:predicted nucleic acid-binding Zn ribbon protein